MTSDGGKGSRQRPLTDKQTFNDNWDTIFKKEPKMLLSDIKEYRAAESITTMKEFCMKHNIEYDGVD